MPFGTILDPIYRSPQSAQLDGYTRCGDSALWTGGYLAAESFRFKVTGSADALANVKAALAGLKSLTDVTGDNRLARCIVPADSPYAAGIESEEATNTVHHSGPWLWVDNTSRDQVVGAFFGLGVAYDFVDDASVRSGVSDVATRLIGYISRHQWSPNDDISSTFQLRPESLQMLLDVARHVNPANTVSGPFFMLPVQASVLVDVQSNSSYFKFNLDYMSLYHLVRLDSASDNRDAYQIVRKYTATHQNAFFNAVDCALAGRNTNRDAETLTLLNQWLQRPNRDFYVDLTKTVRVCGTEACTPIPVTARPPADFLWQRSPFQLTGGGDGFIESAGIDYILPYWMARYYGVVPTEPVVHSAAASTNYIAPGSLASMYGTNLAPATAQASSLPLPVTLGGVSLRITDAAGNDRDVPLLYVSPGQVNFLVPDGTATGQARLTITSASGVQTGSANVRATAPALFSMNGTGSGVAAATAIQTQAAQPQLQTQIPVFQCSASSCEPVPIRLGIDTPIYVTLYGTGIRNRTSLANVQVTINRVSVPVLYAGPTPGYSGLDQVNVALTLELRNAGVSNVLLTVGGETSNAVTIQVQ